MKTIKDCENSKEIRGLLESMLRIEEEQEKLGISDESRKSNLIHSVDCIANYKTSLTREEQEFNKTKNK